MENRRHMTDIGPGGRRKAAQPYAPLSRPGVFPPVTARNARKAAENGAGPVGRYASGRGADRLRQPKQPFRPFWLCFWPQNLTGQLRTPQCQLPAFGAHLALVQSGQIPSPLALPLVGGCGDTSKAHAAVIPCRARASRWAKPRRLRGIYARSIAQSRYMIKAGLDAPRFWNTLMCNNIFRSKGAFRCVNHSLLPCLQDLPPLPPVATPPVNRRFMARAQGPRVLRCSTATSLPVPLSAPRATSFTVRKIRAAAKRASGAGATPRRSDLSLGCGQDAAWGSLVPGRRFCMRRSHAQFRPLSPQGTADV